MVLDKLARAARIGRARRRFGIVSPLRTKRAFQLTCGCLVALCGWGLVTANAASDIPASTHIGSDIKTKFALPQKSEWLPRKNAFASTKNDLSTHSEFAGLLVPTNFISSAPIAKPTSGKGSSNTSAIFKDAASFVANPSAEQQYVYAPNTAPTFSDFPLVDVMEDAANAEVSLWDAFSDAESPDNQLTYTVTNVTNATLYNSVTINPTTGKIILDFRDNKNSGSVLTIRATDAGGLWVQGMLYVWVEPVNDAPVISNFLGHRLSMYSWEFTGICSDVDDNVTNQVVNGYGCLANDTAIVFANGSFSFGAIIYTWTTASCKTWDPHGAVSNTAAYNVSW